MENSRIEKIKEMTLMLMYLTSWEEHLVPGLRRKPDHTGKYPKTRCCWKGYDFDILKALTEDGMVSAEARKGPAVFTEEGVARALELIEQYGIEV